MGLCAISLGGNVGHVPETLATAVRLLESSAHIQQLKLSRIYRTAPMGSAAGDAFHNAAAVFETTLPPLQLLDLLQQIETQCGRVRTVHWGPRTLDLDLILYGDEILQSPPSATAGTLLRSVANSQRLTVPHPAMWYRRFVLDPLADLIPDVVHPVFQQSIRQLRDRLLTRPLPVGLIGGTATQTNGLQQSVPAKRDCLHWLDGEEISGEAAAIVFAYPEGAANGSRVIRLPENQTIAVQSVIDVLTAALDEPIIAS